MEQRRLRLGDILDDYCPRERRLTNHAVVAMIEEDVKQTRCTTCDTEHPYKGGKVPRRKKKDAPAALYKEVLAGMPDADHAPVLASGPAVPPESAPLDAALEPDDSLDAVEDDVEPVPANGSHAVVDASPEPEPVAAADEDDLQPPVEEGPVHRRLIRAQLPRIEGHKEERRLPEFTIRQAARSGNGHFRGGDTRTKQRPGGGGHGGNGNRPHGGPRFAGPRPAGQGRGPASGFRAGQPRQGGPKKRSR